MATKKNIPHISFVKIAREVIIKKLLKVFLLLGLMSTSCFLNAQPGNDLKPTPIKGVVLVKPMDGVSDLEFSSIIKQFGGRTIKHNSAINLHIISVPEGHEDKIVFALNNNSKIVFAERDMLLPPDIIPDDTQFNSQWHHTKIETPTAWDLSKGANIKIAIIDSGVDTAHTDLKDKIFLTWNASGNTTNSADVPDVKGHGTKVAGSAAASVNNGIGIAGIAWSSLLIIVKVDPANDGFASFSTLANAITFAADNGARVANLSYQASTSSTVITAAKYMKNLTGGITVCSAGNAATLLADNDVPEIITVAATNSNDGLASFSNYGNIIDVSAPGEGILTTVTGNGYGSVSGTSFAAPITAGLIALIMAADTTLTPEQVETILETTATDLGTVGFDTYYGYGRINAYKAVKAAVGCGLAVNQTSVAGICVGATATLSASGGSGVYTWSPSVSLSSSTGTSVIASPTNTTTYTVTDSSGCAKSVTVNVAQVPVITLSSTTNQICAGASAVLSVGGATTYSWSPSTGLSSTSGSSVNASPASTTTYTVTATSNGCASQATTTINVNTGTLPNTTVSASSSIICNGSSTQLSAGGNAQSYTWTPAIGLNKTTGNIVTASPSSTTTYTVTGTNGSCSDFATVKITVSGTAPNITVSPDSSNICSTLSVTLTANGPGGTTYKWSPSTGLNVTTGKTVIASPTVTTTYSVTGTKGSCYKTLSAVVSTCTIGVSINESNSESDIYLYPNPTANLLNVQMKNINKTNSRILIYNAVGQIIYQTNFNGMLFSIDLASNPKGLYFVSILSDDKIIGTHKFIIER